jgi:hypothetical protein
MNNQSIIKNEDDEKNPDYPPVNAPFQHCHCSG